MVSREILRLGKPCICRLPVEGEQILQNHVDLWVNATAKQMKGLIIFSKMSKIRSNHCGRSRYILFFNERKLYRINGRRLKEINVFQTVIYLRDYPPFCFVEKDYFGLWSNISPQSSIKHGEARMQWSLFFMRRWTEKSWNSS